MRTQRSAFTLIELLVVIAIIVALLAILMPSMNRAMQTAEMVACQSNLRQLGVGFAGYAADHYGFYPDPREYAAEWSSGVSASSWYKPIGQPRRIAPWSGGPGGKLFPFVGNEDVFLCPTFVGQAAPPAGNVAVLSYTMFGNFLDPPPYGTQKTGDGGKPTEWGRRITSFSQPSRQLIVADESPFPTSIAWIGINDSVLVITAPSGAAQDSVATFHLSSDPTLRTGNGNVLFLDGHTQLTPQRVIMDSKVLGYPSLYGGA